MGLAEAGVAYGRDGMQALAADEVTHDFVNSRVGRIVRRLAGQAVKA